MINFEKESFYKDELKYYPDAAELEAWIEGIHEEAASCEPEVEFIDGYFPNSRGAFHIPQRLVKFTVNGDSFYCAWYPKTTGSPAPLLVHVPGYGGELSIHPDVAMAGYSLLEINPLGYWTPNGFDMTKRRDDNWPVLPDTVRTGARGGYRAWLIDCVRAITWARRQPGVLGDALGFFGTSQGGGGSLLLGSLYSGRGTRCVAADEPFLTNYPLADFRGAYCAAIPGFNDVEDKAEAWHSIGFADTLCHAHRMTYPVLLTAGGNDDTCPPDTIESLYLRLPETRSYNFLHAHGHGHNREFINLMLAWMRLFA